MEKSTFGLAAAILNISTMIPYFLTVIRGVARPNRITWGIWSFLSLTIFFASAASGAHSTLFWLGAAAFNSIAVFLLSLKKGVWEKSGLELWCLIVGILGVILWYVTQKAYFSLYISMGVDLIALLPTVKKVWRRPDSEPKIAWTMGFVSTLINLAAIDALRPEIFIQPVLAVAMHIPVLLPIYFLRQRS